MTFTTAEREVVTDMLDADEPQEAICMVIMFARMTLINPQASYRYYRHIGRDIRQMASYRIKETPNATDHPQVHAESGSGS